MNIHLAKRIENSKDLEVPSINIESTKSIPESKLQFKNTLLEPKLNYTRLCTWSLDQGPLNQPSGSIDEPIITRPISNKSIGNINQSAGIIDESVESVVQSAGCIDDPVLNQSLPKDRILAVKATSRVLAVAREEGVVELRDFTGNCRDRELKINRSDHYINDWSVAKKYKVDKHPINLLTCGGISKLDLSPSKSSLLTTLEIHGDFVVTGWSDGKVIIVSIYPPHDKQTWDMKSPIISLDLEPDYGKKTTKQFAVSTGNDILLVGKGWFGASQTSLSSLKEKVIAVSWRSAHIIWTTAKSLTVYDTSTSKVIDTLDISAMSSDSTTKFIFCWENDTEFMAACGNDVRLFKIKYVALGRSTKYVQTVHNFKMDFNIAGLGPFKEEGLILLGCSSTDSAPEVHIVDWNGDVVANDTLDLPGKFAPGEYHLEYLAPEDTSQVACYFIASPSTILLAKSRTVQDHVAWLVNQGFNEEAYIIVQTSEIYGDSERKEVLLDIGQQIITTFIEQKDFTKASQWCDSVLDSDNLELWIKWIYVFADQKHAKLLADLIPVDAGIKLEPVIYELILEELLNESNFLLFQKLISKWPTSLYNIKDVIKKVEIALTTFLKDNTDKKVVYQTLRDLHRNDKNVDKSIYYSILLGIPDQDLEIQKSQSYSLFHDNSLLLLQYVWDSIPDSDSDPVDKIRKCVSSKMVSLMVTFTDFLAPAHAVKSLSADPKFLHIYLDALFQKDQFEGSAFHDLQIALFAEYDPPQLLSFLRSAPSISYTRAYEICEQRDLIPEMMFLLGKMGDNRKALFLIIERLGDVEKAIEFAKDQNDSVLWMEFLTFSMDKPPFIVGLLKQAGGYIDPLEVIQRIPRSLKIPGLKNAIIKIMSDCSVQLSLRQGCEMILQSDIWETFSALSKLQRRGYAINPTESLCSLCQECITDPKDNLIIFFCSHFYHAACLHTEIHQEVTDSSDALKKATELIDETIDVVYSRKPLEIPVVLSMTEWVETSHIDCPLCS